MGLREIGWLPSNNTTQEKPAPKAEWKEESDGWEREMGTGTNKKSWFSFSDCARRYQVCSQIFKIYNYQLNYKKKEDFLNCNSQEFYYNCKAECPSRSLDLWQHLRNSVLHNKSYWTSLMELWKHMEWWYECKWLSQSIGETGFRMFNSLLQTP